MKKISILLFIIGLIFIGLFLVFKNKLDSGVIDNNYTFDPTKQNNTLKISHNEFVKSHNINSKTKVTYPILEKYDITVYDDYYKMSLKDNNFISGNVFQKKKIDDYLNETKGLYYNTTFNYQDVTDEVYFRDDSTYVIQFKYLDNNKQKEYIYYIYQIDVDEVVSIIYYFENDFLEKDDIMYIYNNIKITNDAIYGNLKNNILKLNYVNNGILKNVYFNIDTNKYNEVVDSNTLSYYDKIINKITNKETEICITKLSSDDSNIFIKYIKEMFRKDAIFVESKNVGNRKVNCYEAGDNLFYIIAIDENTYITISSNKDDISEFLNFDIK